MTALGSFHAWGALDGDARLRNKDVREPSSSTLHCWFAGCPVRKKATVVVGSCSVFNRYLYFPLERCAHVVIKAAKCVFVFVAEAAYFRSKGRNSYFTARTFLERNAIFKAV